MSEIQEGHVIGNQELSRGLLNTDINWNTEGKQTKLRGPSGKEVVMSSSENRLEIKEGTYVFRAELDRDGFIHFTILNEIQGQRSDNLYPSQLFDLVLEMEN